MSQEDEEQLRLDLQTARDEALGWHARADELERKLLEIMHELNWYADRSHYYKGIPGERIPIDRVSVVVPFTVLYETDNKPTHAWSHDNGQKARKIIQRIVSNNNRS